MRASLRLVAAFAIVAGAAGCPLLAHADPTGLSWARPTTTFDGGPLVGTYKSGHCLPTSCAAITVTIDNTVAAGWAKTPGGIVATVQWTDPNAEVDLFAYDAQLAVLDQANFGGVTSQRVFVA